MTGNDTILRDQDAQARKLARSEFVDPVVLEAGAGTGKTATLVARVLVWALGPGWARASEEQEDADQERIAASVLRGIVAITFTEKASVEMSQRLAEATLRVINDKEVIGIEAEDLPDVPRAQDRAKSLLAQMDRVHIETIHAFCRRILSENALAAGIHPGFELDTDGVLVAGVIRDVTSAWVDQALGDSLDEDAGSLLLAGVGPTLLKEAVALVVSAGVPMSVLSADPYPDQTSQLTAARISTSIGKLVGFAHPGFSASTSKHLDKGKHCLDTLAALQGDLNSLQTTDALLRTIAAVDLDGDHKKVKEWAKNGANKTEAKALEAAGTDTSQLRGISQSLLLLLKSTASWNPEILRPALRILTLLATRSQSELRRRGILTFNDLLRKCRDLLRDKEHVVDQVRSGIDQLLVDEVQDTDPLQYDIVRSLALEGEDTPGLFVVGDPKQTIYGFRSADLGAYADFIREVEGHGGTRHVLSVNFRSDMPILDEVEQIIDPIMIPEDGLQPKFEKLLCAPDRVGHRYTDEQGRCAVEYWNSWARKAYSSRETEKVGPKTAADRARWIEARSIAREILDLQKSGTASFKDFAILMKATTQQETYLAALRELGIPYLVEKDKQFFRRREVIDATSALTCVLDRFDQVATLGWLRSSMVGLPDAMILPLWSQGFPDQLAHLDGDDRGVLEALDQMIDQANKTSLPAAPGMDRVPHWNNLLKKAVRDLSALRRSAKTHSLDEFFTNFRNLLGHEIQESARFLGAHRTANLERFLNQSQELLAQSDVGRAEALRQLRGGVIDSLDKEEASPGDETSDAVRVMSIHKAKGLDFDQVFFVALHQGYSGGSSENGIINRGSAWEFNLFGAATPGYGAQSEYRRKVANAETVRVTYVALTRAAKRLVLCGMWPADDKDTKEVSDCTKVAELLRHRRDGVPQWDAINGKPNPEVAARRLEESGDVAWVMPDCAVLESMERKSGARGSDQDHIFADVDLLERRCAQATELALVKTPVNASELDADASDISITIGESENRLASAEFSNEDPTQAAALGTAIHRVLELMISAADHQAFLDHCIQDSGSFVGDDENLRSAFQNRVAHLKDSTLVRKLVELGDQILGREVPLVVRQKECDVIGSLDLLYREAETDQLVVVDFKTDRVVDEESLKEKARSYAAQGQAYKDAVGGVFPNEKNPRFELWFLSADQVIQLG